MKFDCIIINPPYNCYRLHETTIKKVRKYAKRIVAIIPAKDGDIPLSLFKCKSKMKLKIYSYNSDEDFIVEKFVKFPVSEYFVSLPKWVKGLKKFFETGEYKHIYIRENNYENYYSFSFYNKKDLELFKERLFSDESKAFLRRGSITPLYTEILKGIPYIKSYRKI